MALAESREESDRVTIKVNKLNLECSICLELLTDPRVLPCQHTYCASCVSDYVRHQLEVERRSVACCPQCKREIPTALGAEGRQLKLPRNRLIVELLAEVKKLDERRTNKKKRKVDDDEDEIQVVDIIPAKKERKANGHSMQFIGTMKSSRLLALQQRLKVDCEHPRESYNVYCALCDKLYCSVCTALNLPKAKHSEVDVGSDVILIEPTTELSNNRSEDEALLTIRDDRRPNWFAQSDPEERWGPLQLIQMPFMPSSTTPAPLNLTQPRPMEFTSFNNPPIASHFNFANF